MEQTDNLTTIQVNEAEAGQRLDRLVSASMPDLSRTYVQQLITDLHIRVNGRGAKASLPVQIGDQIEIYLPLAKPTDIVAEDLPLDVVYEDDDVLLVNKAAGMVVHPAPGHTNGTLVNALLYRYPHLTTSGDLRPGIVHRLDKDTSGLLVIAKHDQARMVLTEQQMARRMHKKYLALVEGHWREPSGTIDAPIGRNPNNRLRMMVTPEGRYAVTHYQVLEVLGPYSLVRATLETGRTHQIRVHFSYRNRPILNDALYGHRKPKETFGIERHFLHAYHLGFRLPSNGEWRSWEAPLPAELEKILTTLRTRYETIVYPDPLIETVS
ncbi:RluA family pseudouridine synthase [Herpetosiphon llansteffanensis]|uniref:RluA family pseudouridine synthase n=1 Tax=Herpetosiphon llansteffanensis TaxID=2094568 RepID=UPI000D7CA181|nr:RluA family pseudouridine synthase [Herpetosiphon llansteffanensis]